MVNMGKGKEGKKTFRSLADQWRWTGLGALWAHQPVKTNWALGNCVCGYQQKSNCAGINRKGPHGNTAVKASKQKTSCRTKQGKYATTPQNVPSTRYFTDIYLERAVLTPCHKHYACWNDTNHQHEELAPPLKGGHPYGKVSQSVPQNMIICATWHIVDMISIINIWTLKFSGISNNTTPWCR